MAEDTLYKIVKHIFSNWTGLRLAVDHSMGGSNSKQLANDCVSEVTQFCIDDPNLDPENLEDFIEDMMDEKFDTIFEDGSPKEIATIVLQFVQLIKNGNVQQCEEEFLKLPTSNTNWLQESKISTERQNQQENSSSSEDEGDQNSDTPMEEDGWTVVQTRKKR